MKNPKSNPSIEAIKARMRKEIGYLPSDNIPNSYIIRKSDGCVICGAKNRLSIDHIISVDKGGLHCFDNIRVLCINCNSRKKNK